MSRHRDVRAMNIDEEYDGYYDSAYGHSVEEDFCISPRTEAQFLYNRDTQKHSMSAFLDTSPDSQLDECSGNEDSPRIRCDSVNERSNLSNIDRAKLQSCVEAMQNVVGDTISESILSKAAAENYFDVEKALDAVLSGPAAEVPKPPRTQKVVGTRKEFCIHRKYATSNNVGWASKNYHHYKCNIKTMGCSSDPSIYYPLILDLLKILVSFVELVPSTGSQYYKMCLQNGYSSDLQSFFHLLTSFSTNISTSDVFIHRYRKTWKGVYVSTADFKNEFETQDFFCGRYVMNKSTSTEAFHCIKKIVRLFLQRFNVNVNSVSTESSSFFHEKKLHEIVQILQYHLPPVISLYSSATIPSSDSIQFLRENCRIKSIAVPPKSMFLLEKYYSLVDSEMSKFFIRTCHPSFSIYEFITSFLWYKAFWALHSNQHHFLPRLTALKVPYTNEKSQYVMCKMKGMHDTENSLKRYCCLFFCLLKFSAVQTAVFNFFSSTKCDNRSNCKYQLRHFNACVTDFENKHLTVLNFSNFIHKVFAMLENSKCLISYILSHDVCCFSDCRRVAPGVIQSRQIEKKLVVRSSSPKISKEDLDVSLHKSLFIPHAYFEASFLNPFSEQVLSSCYNIRFTPHKFQSTGNSAIWKDVEGDCSESPGLVLLLLVYFDLDRINCAITSAKALYEYANCVFQVVKKCDFLHCFLPSHGDRHCLFSDSSVEFVDSAETYVLFFTSCKNVDNLKSAADVISHLCKCSESPSQERLHFCSCTLKFSSGLKGDALQSFTNECSSNVLDILVDCNGSNDGLFVICGENVNFNKRVAVECMRPDFIPYLNCSSLSKYLVEEPDDDRSASETGVVESEEIQNYLFDAKCSVSSELKITYDLGISSINSLRCQNFQLLCLEDHDDKHTDYNGDDIQGISLNEETNVNGGVHCLENFSQVGKELNSTTPEFSNCDLKSAIGTCASFDFVTSQLSDSGNLDISNSAEESPECCSDVGNCDDLSLDDLFSALNCVKEDLSADGRKHLISYVNTECTNTCCDNSPEVANNLSLADLYPSMESFGADESELIKVPLLDMTFLENSPSPTKDFIPVGAVRRPVNDLYPGIDLNTDCLAISDQYDRSENVNMDIHNSSADHPLEHSRKSKDPYQFSVEHNLKHNVLFDTDCTAPDNFNFDLCVQENITVIARQLQPSDNIDATYRNQGGILNEQNVLTCVHSDMRSNGEDKDQNDLLNKSLLDVYVECMDTFEPRKNSDFMSSPIELCALSSRENCSDSERLNVTKKFSLDSVQNEVLTTSPLNRCHANEFQNLCESQVKVCHGEMTKNLSGLCNHGMYSDNCGDSGVFASQTKNSSCPPTSGGIFQPYQNRITNASVSNFSNDLLLLKSSHDKECESLEDVNSGTEQTSFFSSTSLSDIYLGEKYDFPSSVDVSCVPSIPLSTEKPQVKENCTSVSCTDCGLITDSIADETAEQSHAKNISLAELCIQTKSEPECHSAFLDDDGLFKSYFFQSCIVFRPEDETKYVNCDIKDESNICLSDLYSSAKPIEEESYCVNSKNDMSPPKSFASQCFSPEFKEVCESTENIEAGPSLLDLYINSKSYEYFSDCSSALKTEFDSSVLNTELKGQAVEHKNDISETSNKIADFVKHGNLGVFEMDSRNSVFTDGYSKDVHFFTDNNSKIVHATSKEDSSSHDDNLISSEFPHQTLSPAELDMQQSSESEDEDHVDIPHIDLCVARKCTQMYPADFCIFDSIPLSGNSAFVESKLCLSTQRPESKVTIKTKQSLFAKVLKGKSKPSENCFLPKPPQALPEILESIGYTKYFRFSTPSYDDIVKNKQKGTSSIPGSSSTIKAPNLETVEDEKEFIFNREIGGKMIVSNGEIRSDDSESAKNKAIVPEDEIDSEKAMEKSDVSPSATDEEKTKNDEQNIIPPVELLSKLKVDAEKEVLEAYKKERGGSKPLINLVVIGHVDAGKSTLMGHLLYRLGCVAKKMMHKYEQDSKKLGKSSFMYAWVLDETSEERNRGITMDVAQSRFDTPHRSVTLLDAPGHKDFIPNMITGAAQADVAVLVLDSTRGEFETGFEAGGQTREHTMLIRSLGVSQLAVAVNKLDNVNWDQERYNEIVSKLSAFLKQAGFKESEVQFVPCSGLTGENLIKPPETPELKKWYSGPCLVDVIDGFKPPERPVSKPLRFCLSDVFKGMGSGFCVSGRIEAGYIQTGDKVLVMPAAEQATVKGITTDDTSVQHSFAGDHVTLQLSGVDMNNVTTGCVVCDIARPVKVSARFQARLVIFNITVPITKGFPVILHYQSMSEQAFVKKLISQLHKSTGQVVKKKPRCLTKNTSAVVEIEVIRPICLEVYKDFKELGRFMLRSGGSTIAAGLVTEIL